MAADPGYLEHVLECLAPVGGVTSKAMFGSYGIFHEGDTGDPKTINSLPVDGLHLFCCNNRKQ